MKMSEMATIDRMAAKRRKENREAGIPDMEVGDRHEPCEWFAQIGFFAVLEKIGRSDPEYDSDDGDSDIDHEEFLAARRLDQQRVGDWLREADIKPIANRNGCDIGGIRCTWVDRVPGLKTWAGNQTLTKIAKQRRDAMPKKIDDILLVEAAITGSSGLDRRCATTALEDGFSVDALGMRRVTRVGMELLAIIGLERVSITVHPDGSIEYPAADERFVFRVEDRNNYYGRWGTAERVRNWPGE
jgi:hypothetical protein